MEHPNEHSSTAPETTAPELQNETNVFWTASPFYIGTVNGGTLLVHGHADPKYISAMAEWRAGHSCDKFAGTQFPTMHEVGSSFAEIVDDSSHDWSWANQAFEVIETSENSRSRTVKQDARQNYTSVIGKTWPSKKSFERVTKRKINAALEFAREPGAQSWNPMDASLFAIIMELGERCGMSAEAKFTRSAMLVELVYFMRFLENAKRHFVWEIYESKIPIYVWPTDHLSADDKPFYIASRDGPRIIYGRFDLNYSYAAGGEPFGWSVRPVAQNISARWTGSCPDCVRTDPPNWYEARRASTRTFQDNQSKIHFHDSCSDESEDESGPQDGLACGRTSDYSQVRFASAKLVSILIETARASGTPEEVAIVESALVKTLKFGAWSLKNELEPAPKAFAGSDELKWPFESRSSFPSDKSFGEFLTWTPGPKSELPCSKCALNGGAYLTICGHQVCTLCIREIVAKESDCLICCPSCGTVLFSFAPGENLLDASRAVAFMKATKILDRTGLNALCIIGILVARFPTACSSMKFILSKIFKMNSAERVGDLVVRMIEPTPSSRCSKAPGCSGRCICVAQAQEKLAKHIFGEQQHELFPHHDFDGEGLLLIGQYLNATPFPESLEGIFKFFKESCKNPVTEAQLLCKFAKTACEGVINYDRPFVNALVEVASSVLAFVVFPGISNKLLALVGLLRAILDTEIVIFGTVLRLVFGISHVQIKLCVLIIWLALVLYYFCSMFSIIFSEYRRNAEIYNRLARAVHN